MDEETRFRRDVGPFWIANMPSHVGNKAVSFTIRLRGRELTLGIRLPGWVE